MSEEFRVQQVLARYLRATDARDGVAQGSLFADDGILQIYAKTASGKFEPVGEPLIGGEGVRNAVQHFMAAHPEGRASHHVTTDHLIEVDGDRAHLNAQFFAFEVHEDTRPASGWPAGTYGAQGNIRFYASGYYDMDLRLIEGEWKIVHNRVLPDMPFVNPGA
jgi:hypothetical protein